MLRETIFRTTEQRHSRSGFRLRGHDVKRIETFSDAVFAFAVTLLIVSLEVPKTFDELLLLMRGFVAFSLCFALLMLIWNEQHVFFRRYGLDDAVSVVLNCFLIFIVLFYVYPLKFLFSLWFSDKIYGLGKSPFSIRQEQVSQLMIVYGLGFIAIYSIFFFLYVHALRKRHELQLNPLEVFDTKTRAYSHLIMVGVGLASVLLAMVKGTVDWGVPGYIYFSIPVISTIVHWRRDVLRKRIKV